MENMDCRITQMITQGLAQQMTKQIVNELNVGQPTLSAGASVAVEKSAVAALSIPIGISNRHVHLSREDMDILFGQGSTLTRMKAVKQPGQFAAQETVILKSEKAEIQRVRVLGPLRKETQVELSIADNYTLGIQAPIKMSGDLTQAAALEIIGPKGSVKKTHCAIVAWRHIHIDPQTATAHGLKDGEIVDVNVHGIRGGVMHNVVVRATEASVLEMHIDVEEANAYGLKNDMAVTIMK
ncbi:phosphate propanoyltransferase [Testudinibacter sp. P27/CKL/0425]